MPRRKITTKRRTYRKKRSAGFSRGYRYKSNRYPTRTIASSTFPNQKLCKMRYAEIVSLSTAGGATTYIYSGNSLYDANVTGTGGQALYFDELATIYNRYLVLGAKIHLTFINGDASDEVNIALTPTRATTALTTWTRGASMPGSKTLILSEADGTRSTGRLSMYRSTRKMFAVANVKDNEDLQAAPNASPAQQWYFQITLANNDTGNLDLKIYVKITYYALWSYRLSVSES